MGGAGTGAGVPLLPPDEEPELDEPELDEPELDELDELELDELDPLNPDEPFEDDELLDPLELHPPDDE